MVPVAIVLLVLRIAGQYGEELSTCVVVFTPLCGQPDLFKTAFRLKIKAMVPYPQQS